MEARSTDSGELKAKALDKIYRIDRIKAKSATNELRHEEKSEFWVKVKLNGVSCAIAFQNRSFGTSREIDGHL